MLERTSTLGNRSAGRLVLSESEWDAFTRSGLRQLYFRLIGAGWKEIAMALRKHTYSGTIKISRDDMRLLKAHRKKCTVRLGTASVATPQILMSDGRDSVPIRIVRVDTSRCLAELTDDDAQAEGLETREQLLKDLNKYYPWAAPSDPVTVIYFEPLGPVPEAAPTLF